jgi:hypothetical protein
MYGIGPIFFDISPAKRPGTDLMAWPWLGPDRHVSNHELPMWAAWHGRMMVIAWVILLPLGALIARFFKVTPHQRWPQELDNKFWWYSHLVLQYTGIAIMTGAFFIAVAHANLRNSAAPLHGLIGWVVFFLGWVQVAGGRLRGSKGGPQAGLDGTTVAVRGGDHYDMTRRRVVFEYTHKIGGYVAIALATVDVALGLNAAHARSWIVGLIVTAWVVGLAIFIALQKNGRCVDTYQAIWGPAHDHPGNLRPPIGWGVRRLSESVDSGDTIRPAIDPVHSSESIHEQR